MIIRIQSGIPGFDELTADEMGSGGIPENTATLIYGPPKTGKTTFSYQFAYQGLINDEPSLFMITDYSITDLIDNLIELYPNLDEYVKKEMFYILDTASSLSDSPVNQTDTYKCASMYNPTEIMLKLKTAIPFIQRRYLRFRSAFDSINTLFSYNDNMLILRVLKAQILRIKEAGGTSIITYDEGSADLQVETILKSIVDNIIHLDGDYATVEAMAGCEKRKASYKITDKGIIIGERDIK